MKGGGVTLCLLRMGLQCVPLVLRIVAGQLPIPLPPFVSITRPRIFPENLGMFQEEACRLREWAQPYEIQVRRPAATVSENYWH